jgi:hypothetical protein
MNFGTACESCFTVANVSYCLIIMCNVPYYHLASSCTYDTMHLLVHLYLCTVHDDTSVAYHSLWYCYIRNYMFFDAYLVTSIDTMLIYVL